MSKEVNTELFGVFLDYQILFPIVNMIIFWIVYAVDEKMNKKYLSTLSQDSNRTPDDKLGETSS